MYKDERCARLPIFAILEKMYLDRVLRKELVQSFAEGLRPHQLAALGDGARVALAGGPRLCARGGGS